MAVNIVGLHFFLNTLAILIPSKNNYWQLQEVAVLKSDVKEFDFYDDGVRRIVVINFVFKAVSHLKFLSENGFDYVI